MKKIDILKKGNLLKPKASTIDFLLKFSKSIEIIGTGKKNFAIIKN